MVNLASVAKITQQQQKSPKKAGIPDLEMEREEGGDRKGWCHFAVI